jgi:hypothetical protein
VQLRQLKSRFEYLLQFVSLRATGIQIFSVESAADLSVATSTKPSSQMPQPFPKVLVLPSPTPVADK